MRLYIRSLAASAALAAVACTPAPRLPAGPPLAVARFADADSIRHDRVADGITHTVIHDARGPWAIHVVEIDAARCVPVLEARKPGGPLSARATTSALAGGALVAVNADFFRLPGGTPVGAQVRDGVPLIGPTDWPVFAVTRRGAWRQGRARLHGTAGTRSDSVALVQVNRPAAPFTAYPGTRDGVTLFTVRADTVPADTSARRVLLRLLEGDERAGRGIVTASDAAAAATVVGEGSALLLAYGDAQAWAARRSPGDTVRWHAAVVVPRDAALADTATEVLGGFPMLLRGGADVLHEQTVRPEFGLGRHPRTALGWTADERRLFLVVVDGRQPPYSDGMSLPELAWVFRRLGATEALNLDGGGSTAMVVQGGVVNRPSDREGERAVGNALALTGCRATR
jgi:hypothetical protein